jgi:type I restriction enzyme S subunit
MEELARSLFRAWFVDFEPVRAKARGATAFPSMPQQVFDGLPDTFTDSELGEVPAGWQLRALSDVFAINPSRPLRKGEPAPYLDMKNMPTESHAPQEWGIRSVGSGARFANGDTLVARITPCLENGKTAFVDFLEDGQFGWGSTEYIVLRPEPPVPGFFAYLLARTPTFRSFAITNMTGSSGRQRVPLDVIAKFPVAVAPGPVMAAFDDIVRPLFAYVRAMVCESRKLGAMRDSLLPAMLFLSE